MKPVVEIKTILRMVADNLCFIISMLVRQGWKSHRVKYVLVFQVAAVLIVSLYENFILNDILTPKKFHTFTSLTEVMSANYTFLYTQAIGSSLPAVQWIEKEFNTPEISRALRMSACCSDGRIKNIFMKRPDGIKFVLSDQQLERQFIFERIKILVGYKYPCFEFTPTEKSFYHQPFFTAYYSPIGDFLAANHRRLHSAGFKVASESSMKFEHELIDINILRSMKRYKEEWKTGSSRKTGLFFEGFIVLRHWKVILQLSLASVAISLVVFTSEKLLVRNRLFILYLLKTTWWKLKRNYCNF